MMPNGSLSFRLVATLCSRLWAGRYLVVWGTVRMLALWLEILVVMAVWMVVALRDKLMHLLWTGTKIVWTVVASHGHYTTISIRHNVPKKPTYFVEAAGGRSWVEPCCTADRDSYHT